MKPIMFVLAIMMAFAVSLPSEVLAQSEASSEAAEAEAAAREIGARVTEDYGVIYGFYENAELAVALAERALEAAESEDDYAEAWKLHREAVQYRDSVNDIAVRAERFVASSEKSIREAMHYLSQAEAESDESRIHKLIKLANTPLKSASGSASFIADLRVQLEE